MSTLHHYVQLGWKAEDFIALDFESKLFYRASLEVAIEDHNNQLV